MTDIRTLARPIIAGLLHGDERSGELFATLSPEDLGQGLDSDLFVGLKRLFDGGRQISTLAMATVLNAGEHEADIGHTVAQLEEEYPAALAQGQDLLYLAGVLRNQRLLSEYHAHGTELLYACDLTECERILEGLNKLSSTAGGSGPVSSLDAALALSDVLNTRLESEGKQYLSWGLEPLDRELFIAPGDLVVIGARPSVGKTALSLQFALHLAKAWRVGFVSCETSMVKLSERAVAHLSGVSLGKLKSPELLSKEDWSRISRGQDMLSKLSLEILDKDNRRVSDIRRVALSRRWQVVVVDYLQLLQGEGKTPYERVSSVSRGLQELAQTCGIAVIALAQLSRSGASCASMESLRDSGQIEQDADAIMLLDLVDPDDRAGRRTLTVAKNRDGRLFSCELDFYGGIQTFSYVKRVGDRPVLEVIK